MDEEKIKGSIFNIERFAYQDGPGIRTVIFLKGCPLNCKWCCNPESQDLQPVLMHFNNRCVKCKRCLKACLQNAIDINNKGEIITDREVCTLCGKCTEICPKEARLIKGDKKTVEEVMKEIKKDDLFYRNSGGGVTLSGGEPFQQIDFSHSLLKCCKEYGIHTAIESSLYVNWAKIKKVLDFLDLIMVDIKHMNSNTHKKHTGVTNHKILKNVRKLTDINNLKIVVRIPIIPGINDSKTNIKETAIYTSDLGIRSIEILPYHELGLNKYNALDRNYNLEINPPTREQMISIKEIIKQYVNNVRLEGDF